MKPYVICHMNASVDGCILGCRWRPAEMRRIGLERVLSAGRPDRRDQPCDLPRRRWSEGRAEHLRLQRQGCRHRSADPLNELGEQ